MSFRGMDIDEARGHAQNMRGGGEQCFGMMQAMDAFLDATFWQGGDAEKFKQEWHGGVRQQVHGAATALSESSTTLHREADRQEEVSNS